MLQWHAPYGPQTRLSGYTCSVGCCGHCAIGPETWFLFLSKFYSLGTYSLFRADADRLTKCLSAVVFPVMVVLDTKYYGELTFTSVNFLLTNASSVSLFYGRSPWHYYLTQALPLLCFTSIFWVGKGAYLCLGPTGSAPLRVLLGLMAWTLSVYSLAGHKEWRFLHPLLPSMHILAAKALVDASSEESKTGERRSFSFRPPHLLLLLSLPLLCYVMLFHGRAQIDVMHYLRALRVDESKSIGFLMPCHSTPWQAYLHRPDLAQHGDGALWALGCEPPLQ